MAKGDKGLPHQKVRRAARCAAFLKCGTIINKKVKYLIAYKNNKNLNSNNILANILIQKLKIDSTYLKVE